MTLRINLAYPDFIAEDMPVFFFQTFLLNHSRINDSTCEGAYDLHHEYARERASRPYDRVHVHA